ncbi:alpha/beta hydrolase [Lusitaniella coriacea LEGE 07157]|uniref:Alpha/beta hydrolase n=1 Tax=Lusitaniella coriacea LEGE 07157 TaxID=945747 RepID=A0A8J7DXC5_9CYAN|nr:alpha/beta hydrolase [Lusitaniella coriacea LEGE 07157]
MSLTAISIPPTSGNPPSHLWVALHGWGANAEDLASLAPFLNLPNYQMVFPNAPFSHYQNPAGLAWYALEREGYPGLAESRQMLEDWLQGLEATTGIPLSRTILAGFSQGGAMTLDVGTKLPCRALCSLSGYLHAPLQKSEAPPPALIVHGAQDPVVPLQAAHQVRDGLTALGTKVDYHELEMGHEIQPAVLKLIGDFIAALPE